MGLCIRFRRRLTHGCKCTGHSSFEKRRFPVEESSPAKNFPRRQAQLVLTYMYRSVFAWKSKCAVLCTQSSEIYP